jgi:predicted permease
LAAAGLFVRNLVNLENLNIGFQRDHVLMVALDPSHSGYTDQQLAHDYQRLLERLESIPGVQSASICWMPPISGGGSNRTGLAEGSAAHPLIYENWVGPRYFETVGMPLLAGRDFSRHDQPDSPRVALINQAMARDSFGGRNPIGRHITFDGEDKPYEIVGVVGDAKYMEIREAPPPTVYLGTFQQKRPASQFVIRTAVQPLEIAPEVRRVTRGLLETVTIGRVMTLAEHIDASIVQERLVAAISAVFGALGSLLAAIGIYGLLAYTVARRTNEIGIRMALGATRGDVIRMVLREAVLMLATGLAIGVPFALAGEFAASRMLPNLPAGHGMPVTLGVAAMIAVGILAAYWPARRASKVDPMVALRYE